MLKNVWIRIYNTGIPGEIDLREREKERETLLKEFLTSSKYTDKRISL